MLYSFVSGALGRLTPGAPVVEMTSGNMGAGLAVVCAALGHPLVVTMSVGNGPQRARMLEALGAEVVLVPQVDGSPGQVTGSDVIAAAQVEQRIAAERHGFYVDQFNAREGVEAHETTTGPEIWEQTGGKVDAWVAVVGSGATYIGTAAALRRRDPRIICAAVDRKAAGRLRGCLSPIPATSCKERAMATCRRIGMPAL